jgi:hypothetical protein
VNNTENPSVHLQSLQREVQRKLGRCIIRLQQYESAMKALVANMYVEGPLAGFEAAREQQAAEVSTNTLGLLIGKWIRHLRGAPTNAGRSDESTDATVGEQGWLRWRFSFDMPSDSLARIEKELAELIAMRNDLVHHFVERFNLSHSSGCGAAAAHLDECYELIEDHVRQLRSWAGAVAEAQAVMAKFFSSEDFCDAFLHGINSDGSVAWPRSTIVEALADAHAACQVDGWTRLGAAIRFIAQAYPGHTPTRYGCTTWRQVLRRSSQFEVRSERGGSGVQGQAWYCTRKDAA